MRHLTGSYSWACKEIKKFGNVTVSRAQTFPSLGSIHSPSTILCLTSEQRRSEPGLTTLWPLFLWGISFGWNGIFGLKLCSLLAECKTKKGTKSQEQTRISKRKAISIQLKQGKGRFLWAGLRRICMVMYAWRGSVQKDQRFATNCKYVQVQFYSHLGIIKESLKKKRNASLLRRFDELFSTQPSRILAWTCFSSWTFSKFTDM